MMKYHAPEDVAGVLNIKPSTLRKYSLLLEKKGYSFQKNAQGHRWYGDSDIIAVQKFITFKDSGGMTLEASAQAVSLWAKGSDIAGRDMLPETMQSDTERHERQPQQFAPEELLNVVKEQQQAIERMAETLHKQSNQNAEILAQLEAIRNDMQRLNAPPPEQQKLNEPEPQSQQPEKEKGRSWWQRLRNK